MISDGLVLPSKSLSVNTNKPEFDVCIPTEKEIVNMINSPHPERLKKELPFKNNDEKATNEMESDG